MLPRLIKEFLSNREGFTISGEANKFSILDKVLSVEESIEGKPSKGSLSSDPELFKFSKIGDSNNLGGAIFKFRGVELVASPSVAGCG